MSFNYSSSLGAAASSSFAAIMNQAESQRLAWKDSAKITVGSTNQSFKSANAQELDLDAQASQQMWSAGFNIAGGVVQVGVSSYYENAANRAANAANATTTENIIKVQQDVVPDQAAVQPEDNSVPQNVSQGGSAEVVSRNVNQQPNASGTSGNTNSPAGVKTVSEADKELMAAQAKSLSNRGYSLSSGANSAVQGVGSLVSAHYVERQGTYKKEGAVAQAVAQVENSVASAEQTFADKQNQLQQTVQGTLSSEISALLTVRG